MIEVTVQALGARGVTYLRFDGIDRTTFGTWTAPSGDQVAWFNDPDGMCSRCRITAGSTEMRLCERLLERREPGQEALRFDQMG